jgi:hypothetical protein
MKLNKVLIALCTNLVSLLLVAQTIDQTLVKADSCALRKDIPKSISFYNRALFFSKDDSLTALIHHQLGILYAENNEHENSAEHFLMESSYMDDDEIKNKLILKAAFEFLLDGQDSVTLRIIDTSWINSSNKEISYQSTLYLGLANELHGNTTIAVYYFSKFYSSINSTDSTMLASINNELLKSFNKSLSFAKTLSAIFPGTGQLYSGNTKDAFNSFAINGSLIGLFVYTSISYTWLDGTLAFYQWIPRYYIGGIVHAGDDAQFSNQERIHRAYLKHLQFFQHVSLK